ncbi:collagen-like protein [Rhizobium ruizarguesonis]|uniref:collagen-like triple helix repeat-containing protein n=1 Tax=Rhizobium ruizarguesonis TaxID=2081791 RepID=UPI0010319731|nr:collagen-like protein [Rhizobium ruizarguesonis]TBD71725.1 collagen-like protein [Rhizobium ruizarguesonis]
MSKDDDDDHVAPEKKPKKSWWSENLGTLLTFASAILVALIGLNSKIFETNTPPVAEISFNLATKASPQVSSSKPEGSGISSYARIPVGQTVLFFADRSGDVDSVQGPNKGSVDTLESNELSFTWQVNGSVEAEEVSLTCSPYHAPCRSFEHTFTDQGLYTVTLVVEDGDPCGIIRSALIWRSSCSKTATASVGIDVQPARAPTVLVTSDKVPMPTVLAPTNPLSLDSSHSFDFDQKSDSLKREWYQDGQLVSIDTIYGLTAPSDVGSIALELRITDAFGIAAPSWKRSFMVEAPLSTPTQNQAAQSSPNIPSVASASDDLVCANRPTYVLTHNVVGPSKAGTTCILPVRLITHGFDLSINSEVIVGNGATISAFDVPSEAGAPGARGIDGPSGAVPGASGAPGATGGDGTPPPSAGSAAGNVVLVARRFEGQLTVNAVGQDGGMGGWGGEGGRGGSGAEGVPSRAGLFDCQSGPGRGGDGGKVSITLQEVVNDGMITVSTTGGQGGVGGHGGTGGAGGAGGREGETRGFCGSAGRGGRAGEAGLGGRPGLLGLGGKSGTIVLRTGKDDSERAWQDRAVIDKSLF